MFKHQLFGAVALLVAAPGVSAPISTPRYVEGQVWGYHTRSQDTGSLLKIQRITVLGSQKVYHLSVVGVHFRAAGLLGTLPHIPVSEATLDASVTALSHSNAAFPTSAVDEGIAEWSRAQGGVFSIPVSQIVGIADDQTSKNMPARQARRTSRMGGKRTLRCSHSRRYRSHNPCLNCEKRCSR